MHYRQICLEVHGNRDTKKDKSVTLKCSVFTLNFNIGFHFLVEIVRHSGARTCIDGVGGECAARLAYLDFRENVREWRILLGEGLHYFFTLPTIFWVDKSRNIHGE